ncbi:MAG: universal stress protein [Syntrophobacteraceae bacterium]|jgi:nucleotide-binding universal stress UspA family protein
MKVLVPTDGSIYSMKAVEMAVAMAEKEGAEVTLLSVAYYAKEDLDEMPLNLQEKMEAHATEALKKAKAIFEQKGLPVKAILETGLVPANNIIEMAEEGSFDKIIMGSRGLTGLEKVLIGSTAAKVTAHAPCSVTVVR